MPWGQMHPYQPERVDHVRRHLAGRDLACWCPPEQPCHGDVLLQVANSTTAADYGAAAGSASPGGVPARPAPARRPASTGASSETPRTPPARAAASAGASGRGLRVLGYCRRSTDEQPTSLAAQDAAIRAWAAAAGHVLVDVVAETVSGASEREDRPPAARTDLTRWRKHVA